MRLSSCTCGGATIASPRQELKMALYEMRTYTLYVGKMAEAQKLYTELGFPALKKGGHDKNLVGYFVADTGMINQLVHIWKFKDDGDRRAHWAAVFANKDFIEGFASKFRPLVMGHLTIFRVGRRDYTTPPSDAGDGLEMPRRRAPPRLYLDPTRRDWIIRDGGVFIRTSCAEADRDRAEQQLAHYLGQKHQPEVGPNPLIVDVLNIY